MTEANDGASGGGPRPAAAAVVTWIVAGIATVAGGTWLFLRFTGGAARFLSLAGAVGASRWAVVIPMTVLFYSLDWLRYYALLRLLGHRLSFKTGLELVAVSYFVSSLTPVAELHLPAMVWWLTRRGYPVAAATAATIAKSVYMVLWICVLALVGLRLDGSVALPPVLGDHLALWLAPLTAIVLVLALIVLFPAAIHRHCQARLASPRPAWQASLYRGFDHTASALSAIGTARHRMHVVAHLACIGFIGCYVVIGHELGRGVGLDLGWGRSLSAFGTSLMVAYLSPVPGSIGVTEAATGYLLDPSLPPAAMTAAVLLRLCCWYLVVIPGLILVVREIRRAGWAALRRRA